MAIYPESVLDEIRNRISIVSYIGECVPLKKAGRNFKGLCPFHSEKTPSFMVSDEKEIYHCFGCGEGGNIFSFVMKYEGLSFPEAVMHLAERAGVSIPKDQIKHGTVGDFDATTRKKKLLFRVNQLAAEFFNKNLLDEHVGAPARNYLISRGILDENITQHFLGYADDNWDGLMRHMDAKNVPMELVFELGLARNGTTPDKNYDFFRDRLIFPIVSHRSEILGFGGRILKEADAAKYVNSPDSLIYHKSHCMYSLNLAAKEIRQKDQVFVVEGYMDVLALNQAGIMNAVAPLGTSLTSGHINLLSRYTKNIVVAFDGDSAGVKAAERSLPGFVEAGLMPNVVVLPDGMDPDDWMRKRGKESFLDMVGSAESLFSWYIKIHASVCGGDVTKKSLLISEVAPYFEKIKSSFEFMHYRRLLADELKVDESDLLKQLTFERRAGVKESAVYGSAGKMKSEKLLLSLMLEYPSFVDKVRGRIDPSHFADESYRTIFEIILRESLNGKLSAGRLLDLLGDEDLINAVHSVSMGVDTDDENAHEVLEDCLKYLVKNKLSERLRVISDEIKKAEELKDDEKIYRLMTEKNDLLTQRV